MKDRAGDLQSMTGVDQTVKALVTTYDVLDRPEFYTSEGAGNRVLNQVRDVYNSFGQLAVQYQEHNGVATANSYKVQYFCDNSNPSRLTHMAYPDGPSSQRNRLIGGLAHRNGPNCVVWIFWN